MAAAAAGPRVLLLGAGLAGGLLALALARRGARVTLAGEPLACDGATAISYGGVPWWAGAGDPLGRLQATAPAAWEAVEACLGPVGRRPAELWLHGLRPMAERLSLPQAPAGAWLTAAEARRREPLLALEEPQGVLVLPYARVAADALLAAMDRGLGGLGVQRSAPLAGVGLAQARRQHDLTVLCAGARCGPLLRQLALPVPALLDHSWAGVLRSAAVSLLGERIVMPLQPGRPARELAARELADRGPDRLLDAGLAPAPGGGLLLGQSSWFGQPLDQPPPGVEDRRLLAGAGRLLLGPGTAVDDGWQLQQRPVAFSRDGRPLVGPLAQDVALFCGFGGPFALVPVLAPLLAEALLSGTMAPLQDLEVLPSRPPAR